MARNLVVVESPAKARTLKGMLGPDYAVEASIGHVRDLPKSKLGVDVEHDFRPDYQVPKEKRDVIQRLRAAAADATAIYLATDPDREGEAISWHVAEALDLKNKPVHRVVFHEITPEAIRHAFSPRELREVNLQLVDAQQARRVLDRLVGYRISPLLWRKVRRGLSAGRVQSVALRVVVEREREITAFVPREYWTIAADLRRAAGSDGTFRAQLLREWGQRGRLEIRDATGANGLVEALSASGYEVAEVRQREQSRKPAAPFTTSTMQQEAARKLRFTAKRTMAVAQQLYEGLQVGQEGTVGLITYMRTDSVHVAPSAQREARELIAARFAPEYLPPASPRYVTRTKGAQEAHEAIRPTSVVRLPETLRRVLTPDQLRLYDLVWKRFVASQMAPALFDATTADVRASGPGGSFQLRATGNVLRFQGFLVLYSESSDDDEDEESRGGLPPLATGDALTLLDLKPEQHFTEPQPRFTEATLIKTLEQEGIGRPSTYAQILSTIRDRGYVDMVERRFQPTELGMAVNDLLVTHFGGIMDLKFTAQMEDHLDQVARGETPWVPVVRLFYEPLEASLARATEEAPRVRLVGEPTNEVCTACGRPMVIKTGRYGRFLSCTGFPECKSARPLQADEPSDELCTECQRPMVVKSGRFGRFLACTGYPECKGRRPLRAAAAAVDVPCPQCGAEIVQRRSRRGRTFYGCTRYPECTFTVWSRPLAERCPSCKGMLVTGRGGHPYCSECRQSVASPQAPEPELVGAGTA